MAEFEIAFKKIVIYEGGYSNNPTDKGGETFYGISRKNYPKWAGWKIIDEAKDKQSLIYDKELIALTKLFYKEEFWDYFILDKLIWQNVANEIFEASINLGKPTYCLLLHTAINLLNRGQKLYKDVEVKNYWTQGSLYQLDYCIKVNGEKLVYNMLNFMQARHYINLMMQNEQNEKWIGWFNRVLILC